MDKPVIETTSINDVKETQNSVTKEKNKSSQIFQIVMLIIYFSLAFIISWYFGMKQVPTEDVEYALEPEFKEEVEIIKPVDREEKIIIEDKKSEEFLSNLNIILQNVFNNSENHLIPDNKRNSVDLFKDEFIKFKLVYYIAERYGDINNKKYNVSETGQQIIDSYVIKYDYFKNYYKEITDTDFNEEILLNVVNDFSVKDEYLYGYVLTEFKSNYTFNVESFIKKKDNYNLIVLINENDDSGNSVVSYRMKFDLTMSNEKYVINSIVIY